MAHKHSKQLIHILKATGHSSTHFDVMWKKLNAQLGQGTWEATRGGVMFRGRCVLPAQAYTDFIDGRAQLRLGEAPEAVPANTEPAPVVVLAPPAPRVDVPKVEVTVGVMKATVEAGDDGKFGTEDDKVTIVPVAEKPKKSFKKSKGMFVCNACGHTLMTKRGILAHIEREHPVG